MGRIYCVHTTDNWSEILPVKIIMKVTLKKKLKYTLIDLNKLTISKSPLMDEIKRMRKISCTP